jgi:hypothetical protein
MEVENLFVSVKWRIKNQDYIVFKKEQQYKTMSYIF